MHHLKQTLGLSLFFFIFLLSGYSEDKGEVSTSAPASRSLVSASSASAAPSGGPAAPQTPSLPQAQASPSGSFQWSFPLNVPPGTNGVQPNLSLTYNSAAPNGILGMGFSLTGLSTIDRDASLGINFTSSDCYSLDGQKLYVVPTSTGGDGNFHVQRETYDRIQVYRISSGESSPVTDPNFADSYWKVSKKDGTQLFYGDYPGRATSATDKSTVPAVGQSTPRQWALSKVQDANGNYYTISYLYDTTTGASYPLKMVYTLGNGISTTKTVQFSYETRTDHSPMYQPSKVDLDKRLKWITVLMGTDATGAGGTLVRKYRVDYQYSAITGRTQATAIQEYGKDGSGETLWPKAGYLENFPAYVATGSTLPLVRLEWPTNLKSLQLSPIWNGNTGGWAEGIRNISLDVDGDGKSELCRIWNNAGLSNIQVLRWSGSAFTEIWNGTTGGWADSIRDIPMDVNGDGKPELCRIWNNAGMSSVQVLSWSGSAFTEIWNGTTGGWADSIRNIPMDVNGDGKPELCRIWNNAGMSSIQVLRWSGSAFTEIWNGTTGGWADSIRDIPMDVNGDGKPELCRIWNNAGMSSIQVLSWNGSAFTVIWNGTTGGWADNISDIPMDVNGDGKPELCRIWNNAGMSNIQVLTWDGLAFTEMWNGTTGGWADSIREAVMDVDGDGRPELCRIWNNSGISSIQVLHSICIPDLLTQVTLPTGGTITATYTPAPQIPLVPGVSGPIQPSLSSYPKVANTSPRPLVTQITLDPKVPGMPPVTTRYEYYNGQYLSGFPSERADLGFERVTQIDAVGTKTITTFSQNVPTQGMPTGTVVQGSDGKKYVETITTYSDSPVSGAHAKVRFVAVTSQTTKRFDGKTTSTDTKKSFTEYDAVGNLKKVTNYGIVNSDGTDSTTTDNVREEYAYAQSNTKYLYRMTTKQIYSYDDAASPLEALASETNYYYDGSATLGSLSSGRLTKIENRIDANTTASSTMVYDTWGNVTKTTDPTDPRDPAIVVTSEVAYDTTYHNLVVSTTDARSLTTMVTAWDNGLPTTVQDHQSNVSRVVYDVFGRKLKTISPLPRDTLESPTTETIYINTELPAGSPVVIQTKEKTTGTTYLPTFTYLDGLGRVVQSKTLAKVGSSNYVTVDRYYDALGRNVAVSNPYLSSSSAFNYDASLVNSLARPNTTFTYDVLGRVIQTSRPIDTSNTLAISRTIYDQTKTLSIDALNHVSEVDDRGNVRYQRTYTGTYPNHVLYTTVKATTSRGKTTIEDDKDNNSATPGNKITTLYDMLGRKTQYTDPDMGTWTYEYFSNGSLKKQTDAKGNALIFTYDSAGRVSTKSQGTTVVATYIYGTIGYQKGLLEKVYLGTETGVPYLQYTYDKLGRTTGATKTIGTYGTKSTTLAYNADGRLSSKSFPGGAETVNFVYSPEGLLRTLDGTSTYLSSTSVDDFGRTYQNSWGNGTTTTYTFDPVTFRTTDIVTPGVMNLHYDFYSDGTVWKKTEVTNTTANEVFTYDDLGRLRTSAGLYGDRSFLYDTLGNLLGQNGVATNLYSGTRPHAISDDGTYTYTYDANGNMTARKLGTTTNRGYSYDAENRLTGATVGGVLTTYTYDDTRQRTTLTMGTKTTVFWFDDYEETFTNGVLSESVRSYTAEGQKVAQRSSVSGLVFLYTDHLGSTSKVRDSATGTVTASYYEPFGKLHSTTINGVRESFTGQEWDGSAQLMYYNARFYDPGLGRFIQPDTVLDGLNRYAYCGNNPVNFTDPTGNWVIDLLIIQIKGGEDSKNGGLDLAAGWGKENPIVQVGAGVNGFSVEAGLPHLLYGGITGVWNSDAVGGVGWHAYVATPVAAAYVDLDRYGIGVSVDTLIGGASVNLNPLSLFGGAPSSIEGHFLGQGAYFGTDAAYAYSSWGGVGYAWGKGGFNIPNNGAPVTRLWGMYAGADYQGGQMEGAPGDPSSINDLSQWRSPRDPVDAAMMGHDMRYYQRHKDPNYTVRGSDQKLVNDMSPYMGYYNPYATIKAWLATLFFR